MKRILGYYFFFLFLFFIAVTKNTTTEIRLIYREVSFKVFRR